MIDAVEKVRRRLLAAAAALEAADVPYAVLGDNAVAAWVTTVDEAAVRNTRDVDVLLRRADFDRARVALEGAGFVYRHVSGIDLFLDGPDASARDAVHVVFTNEYVREGEPLPSPDVEESTPADGFRILRLDALVRVKLTAWRDKDRVHLRDLIDVGLLTPESVPDLPEELRARLGTLFED
jgi:ethanolamine ammonia-lyase small subunit